ncbi:M14 family zinc carboxypeptidase [Winogradskyella marincola]|uniref:M14 family zinc carboxypeptidase n=1 Tax=Winogradskyella marincola TaxID=3037795 RepID=A0ABT6G0Q4_9FLAO|nr:M14 family zinc carboxypeptidase [Winogradskyella sp. YYF002]MDG4715630.1 M14 family zinc carboxypeptidase [Winogradskyella sp. YYF002]
MKLEQLNSLFSLLKTPDLFGRYITNSHIEKCIEKIPTSTSSVIGFSVENRPIYSLRFGKGPKKVLMWSQMHGNESTTTKALFDCFNLFLTNNEITNSILETCTLLVIPVLSPDGAERYTRLNANEVDLNRDAQDLSQPESEVLRKVFNDFNPDYCFNLHGQRTIYNVGGTHNSSILSFLSPSQDTQRSITPNRKQAMSLIVEINSMLQQVIPNCVARYDDGFNLNCVGDTFQNLNVPTVLFEAGHYPNDYNREEVRYLMFLSILKALEAISKGIDVEGYEDYFLIPENEKQFYDIVIRNIKLESSSVEAVDVAIQYEERLVDGKVEFIPIVEAISKLDSFCGHREIDAKGQVLKNQYNTMLKVASENDFVLLNTEKISLKP